MMESKSFAFMPCPKCKRQGAHLTKYSGDSDGIIHYLWYVVCDWCRYSGGKGYETQEEAKKAWNGEAVNDGE